MLDTEAPPSGGGAGPSSGPRPIGEIIDQLPVGRWHALHVLRQIGLNACFTITLEGNAYIYPGMSRRFGVGSGDEQGYAALFTCGGIVGSLVVAASDVVGRRTVIRAAAAISLVTSAVIPAAQTFWVLCMLRFLLGCSFFAAQYGSSAWFTELLPVHNRGPFYAALTAGYPIGRMLVILIADRIAGEDWRIILIVAAASLVLVLAYGLCICESPRYLAINGEAPEARRILTRIAAFNGTPLFASDGLLTLSLGLRAGAATPNAQLRALNEHVGGALRGGACALPAQVAAMASAASCGGVSSFGYAGTIGHAVLRVAYVADERVLPPRSIAYRRRALAWRDGAHPFAQRRLLATNGTVAFQSTAASCRRLAQYHVVQGRVVLPATGYLEMGHATTTGQGLCSIFFLQPLPVEADGLHVECAVADGRFDVRSGVDDALADAAVHCSGALAANVARQRVDAASVRARSCARAALVGALYDGFDAVGLQYGPGYRTLAQAWGVGGAAAVARLRSRATREGAIVHPADLDDALCAVALLAPRGEGDGATRLPFAVDDALLQRGAAAGEAWAVRVECVAGFARRCACDRDRQSCLHVSGLQVSSRVSAEASSARLGSRDESPQAQLDGFKSRALPAGALALAPAYPRHRYVAEWRTTDAMDTVDASTVIVGAAPLVGRGGARVVRDCSLRLSGGGNTTNCFALLASRGSIRLATSNDLPGLLKLETRQSPDQLASLRRRFEAHPTGQYVAVAADGSLVGAAYTQRVASLEELLGARRDTELEMHTPDGSVLDLLGIVQQPGADVADQLRRYVLHLGYLDATIDQAFAIVRCGEKGVDPSVLFHTAAGATVVDLVPNYCPQDASDGLSYGAIVRYELLGRQGATDAHRPSSQPPLAACELNERPSSQLPSKARKVNEHRLALASPRARLPSVSSFVELHRIHAAGGDAVRQVPAHRWLPSSTSPPAARHGAFVAAAQCFDGAFFVVSPAEAHAMDPQQRLLLEVGYASVHGKGERLLSLRAADMGAFLGIMNTDFATLQTSDSVYAATGATLSIASVYAATGATLSVAAGRLSYVLGTQVQTLIRMEPNEPL